MAQQLLGNGEKGDIVRDKINDNDAELYALTATNVTNIAKALQPRKNILLNGALTDWPRGVSIGNTTTSWVYGPSRFRFDSELGITSTMSADSLVADDGVTYDALNWNVGPVVASVRMQQVVAGREYANRTLALSFYASVAVNVTYRIQTSTESTGSLVVSVGWNTIELDTTLYASDSLAVAFFVGAGGGQLKATMVQLECGDVATDFEVEDQITTEARCQAYYLETVAGAGGECYTWGPLACSVGLPVVTRTITPVISFDDIGAQTNKASESVEYYSGNGFIYSVVPIAHGYALSKVSVTIDDEIY